MIKEIDVRTYVQVPTIRVSILAIQKNTCFALTGRLQLKVLTFRTLLHFKFLKNGNPHLLESHLRAY